MGAPADLAVQAFLGVVGPDLSPVLLRERGEGQDVALCLDQHGGGVGETLCELLDHPGVLGVDLFGVGLFEDGPDEGAHCGLGGLRHPGVHVADEVDPTALPAAPRAETAPSPSPTRATT
jgi:hypothetical protein